MGLEILNKTAPRNERCLHTPDSTGEKGTTVKGSFEKRERLILLFSRVVSQERSDSCSHYSVRMYVCGRYVGL